MHDGIYIFLLNIVLAWNTFLGINPQCGGVVAYYFDVVNTVPIQNDFVWKNLIVNKHVAIFDRVLVSG